MTTTESLYSLFGLPPTCTDDELRHAYHLAVLSNHPDRNPDLVDVATLKTQQLTAAYAELKKLREHRSAAPRHISGQSDGNTIFQRSYGNVKLYISFGDEVDLKQIDNRKISFRKEWEAFRQNPADAVNALRLVQAAFRAEQQESISSLLWNPILIDSSSLLFSLVPKDDACGTLIKWSEFLQHNQKGKEALQILEDAFYTGMALPSVMDALRNIHYAWAQYVDPTTGSKAIPTVRIEHLQRILELGFKYDYIYKHLAVAYHELGNDGKAREYLLQAYQLNRDLIGAKGISHALGLFPESKPSPRKKEPPTKYRYTRSEQIPSSAQIITWTQKGDWDSLIAYANPQDYSPRILPKARQFLCRLANLLAGCSYTKVMEPLIGLLNFTYYWDVSWAAMTSLARIGDDRTIALLGEFRTSTEGGRVHRENCIDYLRARLTGQYAFPNTIPPYEILSQALHARTKGQNGQARILLERLLANIKQSDPLYIDSAVLLADVCAGMSDVISSLAWIKPLLPTLPKEKRSSVSGTYVSYLWSILKEQPYESFHDEDYQFALSIHLWLVLNAQNPEDVLKNLRSLTHWLEFLGAADMAQWIGQLVRTEAPGTSYVDPRYREISYPHADLSTSMNEFLSQFDHRLKSTAVDKLKQVLHSAHTLPTSTPLLGGS